MAKEQQDIIEFKIPLLGLFTINIRALLRRLGKKEAKHPVLLVAERFLQVFEDHGVAHSQIPRLIPSLSLAQVSSPEFLLSALTPKILEQVVDLFQIQRGWLEGTTDILYNCYDCYKDPWRFLEDIKTLKVESFGFPMVVFTSVTALDDKSSRKQPVLLVMRELCTKLDEQVIYRYRIYDDGWDWGYWKTRIQLKAMVRIWDKMFDIPIPIYHVKEDILRMIESGRVVPYQYYKNGWRSKDACLEDYSLLPEESAASKAGSELSTVLEYIQAYKLESAGLGKNPRSSEETARFR